eukprot:COSAG06_NODE_1022_length_11043_cov_4.966648_2_plen_87_part_00
MQAPPLGIPAGHPLRDTILICRIRLAGLFNHPARRLSFKSICHDAWYGGGVDQPTSACAFFYHASYAQGGRNAPTISPRPLDTLSR